MAIEDPNRLSVCRLSRVVNQAGLPDYLEVLVVSNKGPSPADGVYDHCQRLAEALQGFGHSVGLATGASVQDLDKYSVIHLHYSPFGFPPFWGAGIVPIARRLRNNAALVVTIHEARVNFALSKQGLVIAPLQTLWLSQLLSSAHRVIVPTRRWLRRIQGHEATVIPVGSNLRGAPARWSDGQRRPRVVGLFGHGLTGIGRAAAECLRDELGWQVLVIGQWPLRDLPSTGYLDMSALARVLASVDLLLLPYHDGATGRRTTFQAAMQIGVPTLTTAPVADPDFPFGKDAFAWVPAADDVAYIRRARELAIDDGVRLRLSIGAQRLFAEEFDRNKLTQRTIDVYRRAMAVRSKNEGKEWKD